MNAEIVAEELGVRFDLDRQQRPVTASLARIRRRCTTVWGLRGISFTVGAGEGLALVGGNGAGKTTLLRVIAGVLTPDEGRIAVRGRVGSLLSIDAGLMPRLTGRENSLLLGVLAGLPRAAVRDAVPSIMRRSGLDSAFDRPVSTYSQGMRARLGFAVIEQANPDVLVLDEVYEALDETFREALEARVQHIRQRGGIVVAAGHEHAALRRLCGRVLVLDRSGLVADTSFDHLDDEISAHGALA